MSYLIRINNVNDMQSGQYTPTELWRKAKEDFYELVVRQLIPREQSDLAYEYINYIETDCNFCCQYNYFLKVFQRNPPQTKTTRIIHALILLSMEVILLYFGITEQIPILIVIFCILLIYCISCIFVEYRTIRFNALPVDFRELIRLQKTAEDFEILHYNGRSTYRIENEFTHAKAQIDLILRKFEALNEIRRQSNDQNANSIIQIV